MFKHWHWWCFLSCFYFFFFSFEFVPGTKRNVSGACLSQKRKKSREIKVFTMSYSGLTDITTVRTKMWNRWRNWGTRIMRVGKSVGMYNAGSDILKLCWTWTTVLALSFLTVRTNKEKWPATWASAHLIEINQSLLRKTILVLRYVDWGNISLWFLIRNVCWHAKNILNKTVQ